MSYVILGKRVLNEHIALGVMGLTGFGAWASMRGGSDKKVEKTLPETQSGSDEEAAFIRQFMNNLEHEEKAQAKH